MVIAEVDCGWVPYFKEQIDNNYQRLDAVSNFTIDDLPSAYVERNVHFTFITDTFGVRSRHDVGVENMLWSSDYPHISADWPYSWRSIQAAMSGVPHDEREQLLAGNAVRLYGFGMTLVTTSLDDDGVMLVTLDDPERYNALSSAMVSDLKSAFADIRADRAVRAVIVAGAGRGFCSGANMAGGDDVPESARDRGPVGLVQMFQEHIAELMLAVHELPQPVIAAVHGAAVGGGSGARVGERPARREPGRVLRFALHPRRPVVVRRRDELPVAAYRRRDARGGADADRAALLRRRSRSVRHAESPGAPRGAARRRA